MLLDRTVGIHVMQVAVMQVIDMVFVLHGGMSAIGAVLVIVAFVNVGHRIAAQG